MSITPCHKAAVENLRPSSRKKLEGLHDKMREAEADQQRTLGNTSKFKGQVEEENAMRKRNIQDLDEVLNDPALQDRDCPDVMRYRSMLEAEKAFQMLLQGQAEAQVTRYAQEFISQQKLVQEAQKRFGDMTALVKNLCKFGQ
jgi:hypothetical protein